MKKIIKLAAIAAMVIMALMFGMTLDFVAEESGIPAGKIPEVIYASVIESEVYRIERRNGGRFMPVWVTDADSFMWAYDFPQPPPGSDIYDRFIFNEYNRLVWESGQKANKI